MGGRFKALVTATLIAGVAIVSANGVTCRPAQADDAFPNKVIRVIVGFAAGGGNDIFARVVGQRFGELIGQTVVIENKPGAGGRIASEYVAQQPGDGYTLMGGASGSMSIAPAIYPTLGYHPTNTSSPAFTIATELLKLKTGLPGHAIPYKSSNESVLSVAAGQTLLTISDGPPAVAMVKGGKVRAPAVTRSDRSGELPDVPSMKEAGYPEVNSRLWSGFFAPASTPAPIVAKLEAALRKAMADEGVRAKLKTMAVDPGGGTGAEFRKLIDADIETYKGIVQAAKLKFER